MGGKWQEFDVMDAYITQLKADIETLEADNKQLREAIDNIYNENDNARKAVIKHYGLWHDLPRNTKVKRIEELEAANKWLSDVRQDGPVIAEQAERIRELEAEVQRLRELLSVAKCPNKNCIDGYFPDGPDGEPQECVWCAERKALEQTGEGE